MKTQPEKLSNIKFARPFNLASDPEERIDLSTERPELVQAMVGFIFDWDCGLMRWMPYIWFWFRVFDVPCTENCVLFVFRLPE